MYNRYPQRRKLKQWKRTTEICNSKTAPETYIYIQCVYIYMSHTEMPTKENSLRKTDNKTHFADPNMYHCLKQGQQNKQSIN